MDVDDVLKFTDALVFAKIGKHLNDLQRLIIKTAWSKPGQRYEQIAKASGYSANYLRQDVGPKLWQLLSDVLGEKVKKSNFRATIERRESLVSEFTALQTPDYSLPELLNPVATQSQEQPELIDPSSTSSSNPSRDWGEAPDVSIFYNRSQELATLEQWIVTDRCRLVALLGMGGIGKTHLCVKLAETIQEQFDYLVWRSLRYAPPLQQILDCLLPIIANSQEMDLPATVDEKLSLLMAVWRKQRCLLVLDNVETILRDGDCAGLYQPGYEDYGDLFKRLGECRHNSCLLLTSREKPRDIAVMQGDTLPVRCFNVQGLHPSAGGQMLQLKGCYWNSETECQVLVERYSGNPLTLNMVAATIQDLFAGNIGEFLKHKTLVIDEIRVILDEQFQRLPPLGTTILYWLAIYRNPVSAAELQSDIDLFVPQTKVIETLKSLAQRSLIEKKVAEPRGQQAEDWQDNWQTVYFSLQPVLMEYATNRLIERVCQEIETGELVLLNSHALLKAEAKDYIRQAQISFIVKPITERLLNGFKHKTYLENRLKQIIYQLQTQSAYKSGYAAGNILNLLCHLQTNLTGYDFSHLTVWQAYLQDINLHQVNFTDADLAKSVFAQQLARILSVAFSPNGTILATGDASGEIRLWQVADGKLLLVCQGHAGWVQSVAFSPDGRWLCSGSNDQTLKLWDVFSGEAVKTLVGHHQRVRAVAFSPDGRRLCSGSSDGTVRLWEVESGACLQVLSGHQSYIWSVAFSPDGRIVASGSDDQMVKLWDVRTGECEKTLVGNSDWVRTVAFSPDGKLLASGGGDRRIKLWDVGQGNVVKVLEGHNQRIRTVAFSPDGKRLASGSGDHTVKVWDVVTGRCQKTLHGHSSRLTAIAFSPDGTILASGGEDQAVRFWDVSAGQCLKTWQGYASGIQSVAFSPDGTRLASGNEDQTLRLWERQGIGEEGVGERGGVILAGHSGWVCSVAFSPDGTKLASGSSDRTLKVWQVSQGICLKTLVGHTREVRSVAFSPDGRRLASCSGDNTLKLWDVATGQCLKTWRGHKGWLWSVAFSPDGVTVASASEDKTVKLWDVRTGKCLRTFQGHSSWVQSVAFSPDGEMVVSGGCDQTVRLWQVKSGTCLKTFLGHASWVQSVAFSPDGEMVASGGCDQRVKLWWVRSGQCWRTLQAHTSWIWSVAFSPDGQELVSGSQDGTIRCWDVNTGECLGTLRSKRPYEGMRLTRARGLTDAQRSTLKGLGAVE